jgi:hypothetical protein
MSGQTFKIGDKVTFKTERPRRIATVIEVLEGGWLALEWKGPPLSTPSCDSEDETFAREEPPRRE